MDADFFTTIQEDLVNLIIMRFETSADLVIGRSYVKRSKCCQLPIRASIDVPYYASVYVARLITSMPIHDSTAGLLFSSKV